MSATHWIIVETATGAVLHADFVTPGGHPRFHGWDWDAATQSCHQTDRAPDPAIDEIDPSTWTWRKSLTILRARARARVNAEREARKDAGCDTAIGRVDSDPVSRANVTGAATAAMIAQAAGAPFEINWTLADNSTVTLDAAATIGMGLAVLAHVSAVHDQATALKAAIDAAETAEAIEAVVWPEE